MKKIDKKIDKKIINKNFALFFKMNLLLTIVIFLLFLQYNNNYQVVDFFLAFLGAISSAAILYALLYLILFVFKFTGRFGLYLSAFVLVLVNMALLVDFFIYKLFKFHINGMVVNMLTSPDSMDSIQVGIAPVFVFIILIVSFFLLEFYLIKRIIKTDDSSKFTLNRKLNVWFLIPLLLIVISEKMAYGFSSLFSNSQVLTKFKVIPLYQPLTFNRLATKHFGFKPKIKSKNAIQLNASLNYPLKPLELKDNPQKLNVFIFVVDAVKASVINPKSTPRLIAFKQESIVLNNHHSGGNATRFGIFSLLYGLNASYWFPFVAANKGTVLFDVLKDLDYQINITSSTSTNWPEFKKTCYVQVQDSIKDDFDGVPWKKDEQATAYFKNWLTQQDTKKPIFSFVFFDAPHGYSFPKEVNAFNASDKKLNYITLTANSPELETVKKRYKSAVFYDDKLFGEMLDTLKEKGLYDDALIIYTSDHGQEFFEYGNFGHNTSFSSAQTHVPMVIKLPNSLKGKIELPANFEDNKLDTLTSHTDVVPTLLSLIGVKNKASDYSNGKNIFDKAYSRNKVVSVNWNNNSIITKDRVHVFSNTPNKIFSSEVHDRKTYKVLSDASGNSKITFEVMNENKQFLK